MNPVTVDIKQLLIEEAVGSSDPVAQWAVQIGRFSDDPDELICLSDVPADAPMYLFGKKTIFQDVCRVVVRATGYIRGYSKSMDIVSKVALTDERDINGTRYWAIRQGTSVAYLDKDAVGRHLFAFTFETQRHQHGE